MEVRAGGVGVTSMADAGDDLDVKVLHRDRLHVVSGPSNPWADRRKVALGDLVNDRWVLPPPRG